MMYTYSRSLVEDEYCAIGSWGPVFGLIVTEGLLFLTNNNVAQNFFI